MIFFTDDWTWIDSLTNGNMDNEIGVEMEE